MMALIYNETVVDVSEKSFPVNKNMYWVECHDNVHIGDIHNNGVFLKPSDSLEVSRQQTLQALLRSDKEMARVAEDIIGILIAKGVLDESDLPENVKDKMLTRAALRKALK